MARLKQFDKKLHELWQRRIVHIESLVRKRQGRPKSFTKKNRDKGIRELEEMADEIVTKQGAKAELTKITAYKKRRQIKGRGIANRYDRIIHWAEKKLPGAIIYAFWKKKRCLYVGQGITWKRLRSYEKSIYLKEATLLKIIGVTSTSQIDKAECLSKHLYSPRDNKIDPAKTKWSKACPVCSTKTKTRTALKT